MFVVNIQTTASKTIIDEQACSIVRQTCTGLQANDDILILECLESDPNFISRISAACQHIIWTHINQVIDNENVKSRLMPVCKNYTENFDCPVDKSTGSYLKCMLSKKDDISSRDCVDFLLRIENVAFLDYRWISSFIEHCDTAISDFKCGRIERDRLSQGETIECLQTHFSEIDGECHREILKLSEIQSDNIKLDRQLYMACAEDQMKYCRQYSPGSGRVFKCLMQHYQEEITAKCKRHLLRRQKLISEDFRISKGLMRACRDDIKRSHCRRQTSDDRNIRLAQVLLCLESIVRNGSKVDSDCETEMRDHRKILVEDYRLSPEIVDGCAIDIKKYCKDLEIGGKTIHCLMDHARLKHANNRITESCHKAVSFVLY